MIEVSMREWTLLAFVDQYIKQHGHSPSHREIKTACGYATTSTVNHHIHALADAGVLHLDTKPSSRRTISLCNVRLAVTP